MMTKIGIVSALFLSVLSPVCAESRTHKVNIPLLSKCLVMNSTKAKSDMREISQHCAVCDLEDVPYSKMKCVQKNQKRKVYYDKENNVYVKVWKKDYRFKSYFLMGVKQGFYKDIAPLHCVIFDKEGICRGYITYAVDGYKKQNNLLKDCHGTIKSLKHQNDAFKRFLDSLQATVARTGLAYYDLVAGNISYDGNNYFLIDLESVLDKTGCRNNTFNFHTCMSYNPPEYIEFVHTWLRGTSAA
ncbi:MAG: hypothetical protein NTX86_01170 [Candidatus Dependentiae bacterium]|nr:hypothetical protein [Candidatus Dependentiae bacterium]